jgi:transcriptional regulator with XRE-family HTH domain
MIPDARKHNPDPLYLRELIERAGISQRECARRIGISDRIMRMHITTGGKPSPAPYPVQFALECLAEALDGKAENE